MNIDDIADRQTGGQTPGEQFCDEWLDGLPTGQWPSYIDETAQLVADGVFIGDTDLTKADFGSETGEYYQRGLAETSSIDPSETSLPLGRHSAADVGRVAWLFNKLREEIRQSRHTDFENPSRAIEAAVNKALVESVESGDIETTDVETIRLPETATVSTLVSEVFCRPRSEIYIELLLQTVRESATTGLLDRLDEPRMVTPLWDHQCEALDAWLAHDCRGYVDMATATGKTVLGLAAVAHHFGALHPGDRDLVEDRMRPDGDDRGTVVVVAHRDLILDQWKREFDVHLNIPEQRTTRDDEHSVAFEWGDVHFWTPDRLRERGVPDADLVVLDETHHYLGSSGFGRILDDIDGHVLALSGSLDEANARSLERRDIPELFEFTLRDGQRAGVVPQCDWDVVFTPYENQSQLADVTGRCRAGMERYADVVPIPDGIDVDDGVDLTFETLSEARSLAQSSVGRDLKESDPEFREFASAVMARQLTQYNLSPALSAVVNLTVDHVDQHKCVVLLETEEEVDRVTDELMTRLGEAYDALVTVLDDGGDLSAVEAFDREQDHGAIVGLANTLGEGIDIETADVCINRGRGRLSRSLVQRMGRILRNPDGDKHATFFHISGIPTRDEATLPSEDGVTLLETASQLLAWGEKFHARPVFAVDEETSMTERDLVQLERAGADALDEWPPDHYDWPSDDEVEDHLRSLRRTIRERDGSALLSIERQKRDVPDLDDGTDDPATTPDQFDDSAAISDRGIQFVAADGGGVAVGEWLYDLATAATEGDADAFVESRVRSYLRDSLSFPDSNAIPESEATRTVGLNPALEALLSAYVPDGARAATVHAALAETVRGDVPTLVERADVALSAPQVEEKLSIISDE